MSISREIFGQCANEFASCLSEPEKNIFTEAAATVRDVDGMIDPREIIVLRRQGEINRGFHEINLPSGKKVKGKPIGHSITDFIVEYVHVLAASDTTQSPKN